MRDALSAIRDAISNLTLPNTFADLFKEIWDGELERFHMQENSVLDYKDRNPEGFSNGYGAGLIRLASAFHNSYGGIVVIGVNDKDLTICGVSQKFDIESFNRVLSDVTGHPVECIARMYEVRVGGSQDVYVNVVIVPRRGLRSPARLLRPFDKYAIGTLWVRERHEVKIAEPNHYPMLYGNRGQELSSSSEMIFPVHRSLPPSPATMKTFVSRNELMIGLWEWFVLGHQPRYYLHGPGGSGKSTLAFEFCRSVAENGGLVSDANGERIDYVIYISAKETEFNVSDLRIQSFLTRNFSNKEEQYTQIAYHSGMTPIDFNSINNEDLLTYVAELFDNFSGLIVIDDIDALSRKGFDTGEEELFIRAIGAKKRTRILYTLRFPPSYALNSSQDVPGLILETEFIDFTSECCLQFGVGMPTGDQYVAIAEATSRLPLLIETVVGLKKHCGNFKEAISIFEAKGGEEARRYLYQREYDRLDNAGKARQVLALLALLGEPASFQTIVSMFPFSKEQVADAISEAKSIFLSTIEEEDGEILYQLTPPATLFVRNVSVNLSYYNRLSATVRHFKSEVIRASPEEAAVIALYERLVRQKEYQKISDHFEALPSESVVAVNPRVTALAAQSFSELGPDSREKARFYFKHSYGLGYFDNFMMRRWFNLEFNSGYGLEEAERICHYVVEKRELGPRILSEFWNKLASCYLVRANGVMSVSKEKGIDHLMESIALYCEGYRIGQGTQNFEEKNNLDWMERPVQRLFFACRQDVSQFFLVFERVSERCRNIPTPAADLLLLYLKRLPAPIAVADRRQVRGVCSRIMTKLARHQRGLSEPGFRSVVEELEKLKLLLSD